MPHLAAKHYDRRLIGFNSISDEVLIQLNWKYFIGLETISEKRISITR